MNHVARRFVVSLAVFLVVVGASSGQWRNKPISEWSENDARKVLEDSPWVKTVTVVGVMPPSVAGAQSDDLRPLPGAERPQTEGSRQDSFRCRVRLFSARPIREAVRRSWAAKGDADEVRELLDSLENYAEHVIIAVDLTSDSLALRNRGDGDFGDAARQRWLKAEDAFLEVKAGSRVALEDFKTSRDNRLARIFIFPRSIDGKPLVSSESMVLRFFAQIHETLRLDVTFNVKELKFEGNIEY